MPGESLLKLLIWKRMRIKTLSIQNLFALSMAYYVEISLYMKVSINYFMKLTLGSMIGMGIGCKWKSLWVVFDNENDYLLKNKK